MKKITFVIFLVFLLGTAVFSQNGYLDFRWGMSPDEVGEKMDANGRAGYKRGTGSNDLNPLTFMMFSLYGSEISRDFNGQIWNRFPDTLIRYSNENYNWFRDGGFSFYFDNNKLFGVQTIFSNENIIKELESRHGKGTEINLTSSRGRIWLNNDRYIIWINPTDQYRHLEFVAYLDSSTVRRMCLTSMEQNRSELRERQQRSRSRLD